MKKLLLGLALAALCVPFISLAKPIAPAGPPATNNFIIPSHGMLCRFSATAPNHIGACISPA